MGETRQYFMSWLGEYVDGWSDLVESMGGQAEQVRTNVAIQLNARDMPDIDIERMYIQEGVTSQEKRGFIVTTVSPGVTCAVYIAKHGKDLYASWKTFVAWRINWTYMAIYAAIAASLTLFSGALASVTSAIFGRGWGGVEESLSALLASMCGFFVAFFLVLFVAMIAGAILRRHPLIFILKEPSWFDVDDVAALNFSVHKSILRALDAAGIDVSKLREKREFKSGRGDRSF